MKALHNCSESTDFAMFRAAATYNDNISIDEYDIYVSVYINKRMDDAHSFSNLGSDDLSDTNTISTQINGKKKKKLLYEICENDGD